ncbi:hypothetical protein J7J47_02210, partial [Halomonas sp. ISL-60]|nr:hypothetical protein [Halomonas sp. ISL-60]
MLVVCLITLIVVGPHRLPRVIYTLGLWASKLRTCCLDLNRQFQREALAEEVQQLRQRLEQARNDTERSLLDTVDIDRDYRQPRAVATSALGDAPVRNGVEMNQQPFSNGSTCRTPILTRVAVGRAAVNGVTYQSDGVVALISDRASTLLALASDFTQGRIIAIAP